MQGQSQLFFCVEDRELELFGLFEQICGSIRMRYEFRKIHNG